MGRRYPDRPVLAVAGVVLSGPWVLLIKRGAEPAKDIWSIPGGMVELGESLEGAVAREIAEETGVAVTVGPVITQVERLRRDPQGRVEYHYVILEYLCHAALGPPVAGDDAARALWAPLDRLEPYALGADTLAVIRRGVELDRGDGLCP